MAELVSRKLDGFEYRTPILDIVNVDGKSAVRVTEDPKEMAVPVPSTTFLFLVETAEIDTKTGEIVENPEEHSGSTKTILTDWKGLDCVNSYLMHLSVDKGLKDTGSVSRGLLLYFQFLMDHDFEWNNFPHRPNQRPTYRFKSHLEMLYREGLLAVSTCKSYLNVVVNFYKFYMLRKYEFDNPPFEHEVINLLLNSKDHSSMKPYYRQVINTTDLRLRLPNKQNADVPNYLRSLTDYEWDKLDHILNSTRRGIKINCGQPVSVSIAIEVRLLMFIMRYTGMRREEAVAINREWISKPTEEQLIKGCIRKPIGYSVGIHTKGGKEREIEIPAKLMAALYEYSRSSRYMKRVEVFNSLNNQRWTPLFIAQGGKKKLDENTLNGRWLEIKRVIDIELGYPFDHKMHNLRATYAVMRLKELINNGMPAGDALVYIQNRMGHSSLATTQIYLKQTEGKVSAFEKAEDAISYVLENNGFNTDGLSEE